jgi:hypothetical protein
MKTTPFRFEYYTHRAAMGDRVALAELKKEYPQRAFRRKWNDSTGYVLYWRQKGSKASWKPA